MLQTYLRRVAALVREGASPAALLVALADVLGDERGLTSPLGETVAAGEAAEPIAPAAVAPPPALRTPWLLGWVHEGLLDATARRRAGAHYTPRAVAQQLVAFARRGHDVREPIVCDPAAGGGAFLLAAADALQHEGVDRECIVHELCWGIDIDPLAAAVTRASLTLWVGAAVPRLDEHVVAGDALLDDRWSQRFDLVVGNPPFQNQLERGTARTSEHRERLRARFGDAVGGYVDSAALFLLRGLELASPRARVALVQPHSTLVARDAAVTRRRVVANGRVVGAWYARDKVFPASVRVWAPVLDVSRPHCDGDPVERRVDGTFERAVTTSPPLRQLSVSWSPLVADLTGVPEVHVTARGRVGDIATATAGFRDQFYGLVAAVEEEPGDDASSTLPRLVTSGLIDVLNLRWGDVPARFARECYERPIVRLDRVDESITAWVRAQLVPKVLLATQTQVLEAVADPAGRLVPSTPVIAVHASRDRLWHVVAALSAPPVSAHALITASGAAMSADRMKLSAKQVLDLPLPSDQAAWDRAAALARRVAESSDADRRSRLAEFAVAGCAAYGAPAGEVVEWWLQRALPRGRPGRIR